MVESRVLNELLLRWRELMEQGRHESAEHLCAESPELLDELQQQIAVIRSMESFLSVTHNLAGLPSFVGNVDTDRGQYGDRSTNPDKSNALRVNSPNRTIAGYEILGELGRGGMGVVYLARQTQLKRLVAIKMILAGGHVSDVPLARFRAEAEAVGRLQHPNIVQIYEIGEQDGLPFLALEYVSGGSLATRLNGTPQPARMAAELVETLARTVHAAHRRGIVHRDLKPANVLLQPKDETNGVPSEQTDGTGLSSFALKVTDFGLAKQSDAESNLTETGVILGTPSYMAPEQASGRMSDVGPLADVYALGAIIYELVTGRPPFKGASPFETLEQVRTQEPVSPKKLIPTLPRDLEVICLKCLRKDVGRRYASAAELSDDLQRFLRGEPIHARPASIAERVWRWCLRNPKVASLSVFMITGFLILATGIFSQWRRAEFNHLRADQNFRTAVRTVDDFFTVVSDDELLNEPGMQPLRKKLLQRAANYYQDFVSEHASDPDLRSEHVAALFNLANLSDEIESRQQSLKLLERARDIQEDLLRIQPNSEPFQMMLSRLYQNLGSGYKETGQFDRAVGAFQKAQSLRETLVRQQPTSADLQADLARTRRNLGFLLHRHGEITTGLQLLDVARSTLEQLVSQNPDNVRFQSHLADTYSDIGSCLSFDEARPYQEKVLELRKQLAELIPSSLNVKFDLAIEHLRQGVAWTSHDPQKAGLEIQEAQKILESLHDKNPDVLKFQLSLTRCFDQLGFLAQQGAFRDPTKLSESLRLYDRARELCSDVVTKDPETISNRQLLAMIMNGIGLVQRDLGKRDESLAAYREALAIQEEIVRQNPSLTDTQRDLAGTHHNIGRTFQEFQDWQDGREAFRQSQIIRKRLSAADPAAQHLRFELGLSAFSVGQMCVGVGQVEEALEPMDDAHHEFANLISASPTTNLYSEVLDDICSTQFVVLSTLRRPLQAAAISKRRLEYWPADPNQIYKTARELAVCVSLAAGDSLTGKESLTSAEPLANEAIEVLRRAISAGLSDPSRISREPELNSLRDQQNFERLLAEISASPASM